MQCGGYLRKQYDMKKVLQQALLAFQAAAGNGRAWEMAGEELDVARIQHHIRDVEMAESKIRTQLADCLAFFE